MQRVNDRGYNKCHFCSKVCSTAGALGMHMRSHRGEVFSTGNESNRTSTGRLQDDVPMMSVDPLLAHLGDDYFENIAAAMAMFLRQQESAEGRHSNGEVYSDNHTGINSSDEMTNLHYLDMDPCEANDAETFKLAYENPDDALVQAHYKPIKNNCFTGYIGYGNRCALKRLKAIPKHILNASQVKNTLHACIVLAWCNLCASTLCIVLPMGFLFLITWFR